MHYHFISHGAIAESWCAVFTIPRHEKQVEKHFVARGIENFLPLYRTKAKWKNGSKMVLELPLFSNYIFVHINNGGRRSVLEVPGVISIVGGARAPWSVPDSYIHFLREGLRQGKIEPHPYLTEGTRVRIRTGVMAGTEGILLRRKNHYRVVLTLEMIMNSVTVEVESENIEPVSRMGAYRPQIAVSA